MIRHGEVVSFAGLSLFITMILKLQVLVLALLVRGRHFRDHLG
jgi:hypothetical protein